MKNTRRFYTFELLEKKCPLAAAHAEQGNFDEAVRWATEALKLAPYQDKSKMARRIRSYRNRKPWRSQ